MDWKQLTADEQIDIIRERSAEKPQLIFKHSTRCAISSMAKSRLERATAPDSIDFYYLDLIANRALSQKVASSFGVEHESPQVLLIKDGRCVYNESHSGISMDEILVHSSSF
ncbi:MAG: bacillithiol system redox-active protein YtxJ [Bacteroidota bacterium]|nr:bacillithiol system redox-active protein YtxJ [Bacteroidota bacterium]